MILKVSEIFYSLQGEGSRSGEPSIFVRLSGCSAKQACFSFGGVECDTEFESGREMTLEKIHEWMTMNAPQCRWIVFTGGEPLDQLTREHLEYFVDRGFKNALETSGARYLPLEMSFFLLWVAVSPKVAEHVLVKHFPRRPDGFDVDELRYVRHLGQGIPVPSLNAKRCYLSPHAAGAEIQLEEFQHCIDLCLEHPSWSLSTQLHKVWKIL